MNQRNINTSRIAPASQRGAVLIVALVILAAITAIGVANMKSTTLEMRMAASAVQRSAEFAFAERILTLAEKQLEDRIDDHEKLLTDACGASGSNDCIKLGCHNGLCFDGVYDTSVSYRSACEVANKGDTIQRDSYWKDDAVWDDDSITITVNHTENGESVQRSGRYIAEFLCFVDSGANKAGSTFGEKTPGDAENESGLPIFRVTVLVDSDSGGDSKTPIMLQSNYILKI